MFDLEIDRNSRAVQKINELVYTLDVEHRPRADEGVGGIEEGPRMMYYLDHFVERLPVDGLSFSMWESQVATLPLVFKPERVRGLYEHYDRLRRLQAIHQTLQSIKEQHDRALAEHAAGQINDQARNTATHVLSRKTRDLFAKQKGIINQLR